MMVQRRRIRSLTIRLQMLKTRLMLQIVIILRSLILSSNRKHRRWSRIRSRLSSRKLKTLLIMTSSVLPVSWHV
jgi:hypothetical protein